MDYEKEYKKLKAGIQNAYLYALTDSTKAVLEKILPELKESEDEKVRKGLIKAVSKTFEGSKLYGSDVTREEALSWLEKQGTSYTKKDVDYTHEVETGNGNIKALVTKKVQLPKFHEGEWLCENEPNNYARFIQILEIVNVQGKERYRISRDIHNDEDVVEFNFVEEYYHKFDIKDAKDGDVLAINWQEGDDSWEKIIIFKKYHNKGVKGLYSMPCIEGYGNTFKNGELAINEEVPYYSKTWTCNLHPATKEQRDTLMKAMTDAGWVFDFEKK